MRLIPALLICLLTLSGCSSFQAKRVSDSEVDKEALAITGEWVDGDTIRVIQKTIKKIDKHRRFGRFLKARNNKPLRLFVGEIKNNTSEAYFPVGDMEEALLEQLSDTETFILIDAKQRTALLKELTYQNSGAVSARTAKKIGRQSGADALLFGTVNMRPFQRDGQAIKTYTINFRLTDLSTGEELLRTRSKINKFIDQSASGW